MTRTHFHTSLEKQLQQALAKSKDVEGLEETKIAARQGGEVGM